MADWELGKGMCWVWTVQSEGCRVPEGGWPNVRSG